LDLHGTYLDASSVIIAENKGDEKKHGGKYQGDDGQTGERSVVDFVSDKHAGKTKGYVDEMVNEDMGGFGGTEYRENRYQGQHNGDDQDALVAVELYFLP